MRSKGFDYNVPTRRELEKSSPKMIDLPPDEFARTLGYGAAALIDSDPSTIMNVIPGGMSPEERERWELAYRGDPEKLGQGGCFTDVSLELTGLPSPQAFIDMDLAISDMEAEIAADPRVLELESQWSSCMAQAGYKFAALTDPERVMLAYASTFNQQIVSDWTLRGDELPQAPSSKEELREVEIELAVTDRSCRGPIEPDWIKVRDEHQRAFLEDEIANSD